jgi:hypothetical protein
MDADRFDALSRALTTAPSRRKTLGALLGALLASALPGFSPDTRAAARKRNGRDVGAATHCLPPGAKPCKKGSQCCSGRCKKKKKKCLDCATGTTYCASQEACVDSAQFDTLCTDDGGTCTNNSDCCPSGGCTHSGSLYKTCSNGSCVCEVAHPDYPHACDWPPNPSQCHQCCVSDDCVVRFNDPDRVCLNGNCVCDGDKPDLCRVFNSSPLRSACTNTQSDPTNCGSCARVCNLSTETCVNGGCVPKP